MFVVKDNKYKTVLFHNYVKWGKNLRDMKFDWLDNSGTNIRQRQFNKWVTFCRCLFRFISTV